MDARGCTRDQQAAFRRAATATSAQDQRERKRTAKGGPNGQHEGNIAPDQRSSKSKGSKRSIYACFDHARMPKCCM